MNSIFLPSKCVYSCINDKLNSELERNDMTRYIHTRFHVTASQIAIALICLSSPLGIPTATWGQPQTATQIRSSVQQLKNPQQRSAAIDYLATVGKPAVPALITALEDSDPQVRASAAIILGKIGPAATQAVPVLLRVMKDKEETVRFQAVQAVTKIDRSAVVPIFIAGLDSDKDWERYSAVHALRALGKDAVAAVPALIKKLQDKDVWIRINSASALGRIGTASTPAVPALVTLLQDPDITARHSAAYALGIISSKLQEENPNQISTAELNTIVTYLEKALKVVRNPSLQFREEAVTSVSDALVSLKKERQSRVKS